MRAGRSDVALARRAGTGGLPSARRPPPAPLSHGRSGAVPSVERAARTAIAPLRRRPAAGAPDRDARRRRSRTRSVGSDLSMAPARARRGRAARGSSAAPSSRALAGLALLSGVRGGRAGGDRAGGAHSSDRARAGRYGVARARRRAHRHHRARRSLDEALAPDRARAAPP